MANRESLKELPQQGQMVDGGEVGGDSRFRGKFLHTPTMKTRSLRGHGPREEDEGDGNTYLEVLAKVG